MSLALYFFWLLPIPILIYTVMVMYRRKQHLVYLVFWIYLIFQASSIAISFLCRVCSYKLYFYEYWTVAVTTVIFNLFLLRTIFTTVLTHYASLGRVRRIGYEIALASLWCAALIAAFQMSPPEDLPQKIMRAELVLNFTAVGMFLFVVIASVLLGIKWTSALSGMAAGLGLLGIVDLTIYALWSRGGRIASNHLTLTSWASTLAFDAAVGIFAFYFIPEHFEAGSEYGPA